MLMIHKGWVDTAGNADELRAEADVLDKLDSRQAAMVSLRTGLTSEEAMDLIRAATWYTGPEAVEAGLAQEVIELKQVKKDKKGEIDNDLASLLMVADRSVAHMRNRLAAMRGE